MEKYGSLPSLHLVVFGIPEMLEPFSPGEFYLFLSFDKPLLLLIGQPIPALGATDAFFEILISGKEG